MKLQIENSISRIAEKASGRYKDILNGARERTENAAGTVSKGKGPIKVVSNLGLKLTAVSHKTVEQVLKQQTRLVEHQIDAVASGLRAAANAGDLRDLVGTQIRLIPQNASRLASDARDTLSIVSHAGQEIGKLVKGTVAELRGKKQPAKTVKKAAPKTSKKAGKKKTATKKTIAAKPAGVAGEQQAA